MGDTPLSEDTYTYDTAIPDRLTHFNNKAITYDDNGCVTSYDGWTYVWDNGKLASIKRGGSSLGTMSKTYTFTYNGYGQRTQKKYSYFPGLVQQLDYMTSRTSDYTYDTHGRLIEETKTLKFNNGENIVRNMVYLYDESDVVGMIYTVDGVSNTYYFRKNPRGDVTEILDNSGATVVRYKYDAWGNCTTTTSNYDLADANPFRYRSYYFDYETGLYYLNSRYYNPLWRRFISPDSTEYLDPETPNGLNLYAYCNNDPVNYCDPSGHWVETVVDVGFALWSLYDFIKKPSLENAGWLALDVVALVVPFLPAGSKVITKADDLLDVVGFVNKYDEVIVLGQSMTTRVSPYADEIGAAVYGGLTNFEGLEKAYGTVLTTFIGYFDNMALIIKESL